MKEPQIRIKNQTELGIVNGVISSLDHTVINSINYAEFTNGKTLLVLDKTTKYNELRLPAELQFIDTCYGENEDTDICGVFLQYQMFDIIIQTFDYHNLKLKFFSK